MFGEGKVGVRDGGLRSEMGELGIGGSEVGGTLGTEVDRSGRLGVGGCGVGGNMGTFGGQLFVQEVGERTSILTAMSLNSFPTLIDNTSTPAPQSIDEPSHTRWTRGRSTQRKTSHDVGVDRKPATKRHVVESFEHEAGRDRRAPASAKSAAEQATASAINHDDDDDDDNNGDGRNMRKSCFRCRWQVHVGSSF